MTGLIATVLLCANTASSQAWKKDERTDPLRDTHFIQFSLDGKYLTPPKNAPAEAIPSIVVRCAPKSHNHGHTNGVFIQGYIFVGGIVDSQVSTEGSIGVTAQFRLDDGKLQTEVWSHSTDFSAIFFSSSSTGSGWDVFANLLYAHHAYHKQDTNHQVRKVVIGVPEYLGGEIVMQFDMPDASDVAETCGIIWHT
jgi:hypothetical protein